MFESYDPQSIKEKILPLFDDMLLQKLQQKESKTVDILATYLAEIITRSAQKDMPGLSRSLQGVISPAIAKEIADNKDKMVDALYPIIGNMISKYVTNAIKEILDGINSKIEDGFSLKNYKRKIKAKVTGVSESELLLEESMEATINALFIIQKDTGLLVAAAQNETHQMGDPHMVASMASAIRDFVNDWIKSHKESTEVQLLSYGNATLYIESAGSVYLIAFLDAEPDYEQRGRINRFFATLIKRYSDFFQRFDGDDRAEEIAELQERMQHFLAEAISGESEEEKRSGHLLKYLMGFLVLLLIGTLGYRLKHRYDLYRIEEKIYQKTGERVELDEEDGSLVIKGDIHSLEGLYALKRLIRRSTGLELKDRTSLPVELLDRKIARLAKISQSSEKNITMQLESMAERLASFEDGIKEQSQRVTASMMKDLTERVDALDKKLTLLQVQYSKEHDRVDEVRSVANIRHDILGRLRKAFGKEELLRPDGSLDFSSKHLFDAQEAVPKAAVLPLLKARFNTYLSVLIKDPKIRPFLKRFVIEGYTDSSGDREANDLLSQKRAETIKQALITTPVFKTYPELVSMISTKGLGDRYPIIVNGKEDKEASRRIKIKFELNEHKMIDTIKSRVQ